ncbi:MAG: class I SAM-dependent methyltransferase, partial [Anaerolineae bacterium]|nr:class I SAM-dependent methyltransferase [Anaerolineae bacterium]
MKSPALWGTVRLWAPWRKIHLALRRLQPTLLLESPLFYSLAQRLVSVDYRAIRQAIRKELGSLTGCWVIDLGCGTGNLADEFRCARYVGVDVDLGYIRFAQRTTGRQFVTMDVTELALRDDIFDAALAVGLTHHLDDFSAERFACEIRRVCRDGAR